MRCSRTFILAQSTTSTWFGGAGLIHHPCVQRALPSQALGYSGRAASKDHPEYLIAHRPDRLILNLVDVDNVNYIGAELVDAALAAIHERVGFDKVLVHCNQGASKVAHNRFSLLGQAHGIFSWPDARRRARQVQSPVPALQPRPRDGGICPDQLGALHALESDLVRPNFRSQDFSVYFSARSECPQLAHRRHPRMEGE